MSTRLTGTIVQQKYRHFTAEPMISGVSQPYEPASPQHVSS
jgi:hypothetical protein